MLLNVTEWLAKNFGKCKCVYNTWHPQTCNPHILPKKKKKLKHPTTTIKQIPQKYMINRNNCNHHERYAISTTTNISPSCHHYATLIPPAYIHTPNALIWPPHHCASSRHLRALRSQSTRSAYKPYAVNVQRSATLPANSSLKQWSAKAIKYFIEDKYVDIYLVYRSSREF